MSYLETLARAAVEGRLAVTKDKSQVYRVSITPTTTAPSAPILSAEEKVKALKQMGFERVHDDHQPSCPYAIDEGYVCNCIMPADMWHAPDDVLEYLGQTVLDRVTASRTKDRTIPDVER